MRIKHISFFFSTLFLFSACAQNDNKSLKTESTPEKIVEESVQINFELNDFFSDNLQLIELTEEKFKNLSNSEKVAQLLMPAIGKHGQEKVLIDQLVSEGKIGGLLMLNGSKSQFSSWISEYNEQNLDSGKIPFLYSADAEPSLINRKITNTIPIQKANTLKTKAEVVKCADMISSELNDIGINYNFAPVVDMSPNKTVGWRSFGHQPDSVITWSDAFIQETQKNNIIATAKHFPGHGFVTGDTHKKLVYIDGEMKELKNYPELINNKVMSVMVAHIAIKNNEVYNTNDMPATTSRKIVTELLRDSLHFQGLIVTDAMNMGGVSSIEGAEVLAIEAGCDIILMPLNAKKAHERLLKRYNENIEFAKIVDKACKRILRAKLAVGLFNS